VNPLLLAGHLHMAGEKEEGREKKIRAFRAAADGPSYGFEKKKGKGKKKEEKVRRSSRDFEDCGENRKKRKRREKKKTSSAISSYI